MVQANGLMKVKDMSLAQLKQLVVWSLEVKPEEINDDDLSRWHRDFGDLEWQNASVEIGSEVKPAKKMIAGEEKVTALHITTIDEGFKDNMIHHYCISTNDGVLRIKERGQSDLAFGDLCVFECVTQTEVDENGVEIEGHVYHTVKKDTSPTVEKTLKPHEVFKRMNEVKKDAWDVVDGEIAILELTMHSRISPWKGKPIWVKDDTFCGFRMTANALQERDDDTPPTWVSLMFSPQKYGKQEFFGFLRSTYQEDVMVLLAESDMVEAVTSMFVPQPSTLKVFAIGRLKLGEFNDKIQTTFSPCAGIMLDADSQMPDFLKESQQMNQMDEALESGEITQEEPEPEQPEEETEEDTVPDLSEDEKKLKKATFKTVKRFLRYSDEGVSLEGLNAILEDKGVYSTKKDYKQAMKELGR